MSGGTETDPQLELGKGSVPEVPVENGSGILSTDGLCLPVNQQHDDASFSTVAAGESLGAVYLAEFDAWLWENFGYARDSQSETEALERCLCAGRNAARARKAPFHARAYFSRRREAPAAAPPLAPLDPDRDRPTRGWRPASGRLEPLAAKRVRLADVEMSLRPSDPEYFRNTYADLLGPVYRSVSLLEARAQDPSAAAAFPQPFHQPHGGRGAAVKTAVAEQPEEVAPGASAFALSERPAEPSPRAGAPPPLEVKGDSAVAGAERAASARPAAAPSPAASSSRPATADTATPTGARPNLGRRVAELRPLRGILAGALGRALAGLTPEALDWAVPTREAMAGAGNVSARGRAEEDTMPAEDVAALLKVMEEWPAPGRPLVVARRIAELVQPLPVFYWMDERLRPSMCQHLTLESHRAGSMIWRKGDPADRMCVVLSGGLLLFRDLERSRSDDRRADCSGESGPGTVGLPGLAQRRTGAEPPALEEVDSFAMLPEAPREGSQEAAAGARSDPPVAETARARRSSYDEWLEQEPATPAEGGSPKRTSSTPMARASNAVPDLTLGPGEVYGNRALVEAKGIATEHTARATEHLRMASLTRRVYGLVRLQAAVLRVLGRLPPLQQLRPDSREEILDDIELKVASPSQVVIREGDDPDRVFVVVRGHVIVAAEDPFSAAEAAGGNSRSGMNGTGHADGHLLEASGEDGTLPRPDASAEAARGSAEQDRAPDRVEEANNRAAEQLRLAGLSVGKSILSPEQVVSMRAQIDLVEGSAESASVPEVMRSAMAENRLAPIRVLGPGETFGEMGVLAGKPRSASVLALTEVELVSLARSSVLELLAGTHVLVEAANLASSSGRPTRRDQPPSVAPVPEWPSHGLLLRRLLRTAPSERKAHMAATLANAFQRLACFEDFAWSQALEICRHAAYQHHKSGERIPVRGSPRAVAYILLNGTAQMRLKRKAMLSGEGDHLSGEAVRKTIGVFGSGERFGELALLEGRHGIPHDASAGMSALCETECELLVLDSELYSRTLRFDDARQLSRLAAQLAASFPFSRLPNTHLVALAALGTARREGRGTTLLEQGRPAELVHVLIQGEARLRVRSAGTGGASGSSLEIARLGPGDNIGLGVLVHGAQSPMLGSLVAVSDVQVLTLEPGRLVAFVSSLGPKAASAFLSGAAERDRAIREAFRSGLESVAALAQEATELSSNQRESVRALLEAAAPAQSTEARDAASEAAQSLPETGSAVAPINPVGGGHHDFRHPSLPVGFGVADPLREHPVELAMERKQRARLDAMHELSSSSYLKRAAEGAIEVVVPLATGAAGRKPVPGKVPKSVTHKECPPMEPDASVLPTRGNTQAAGAVAVRADRLQQPLWRLPVGIQALPDSNAAQPTEDRAWHPMGDSPPGPAPTLVGAQRHTSGQPESTQAKSGAKPSADDSERDSPSAAQPVVRESGDAEPVASENGHPDDRAQEAISWEVAERPTQANDQDCGREAHEAIPEERQIPEDSGNESRPKPTRSRSRMPSKGNPALGSAAERNMWIRNTYYQAVVLPTFPKHRLVRVDLLSQEHFKGGQDSYVQLSRQMMKDPFKELHEYKKDIEKDKALERDAREEKERAFKLLVERSKFKPSWHKYNEPKRVATLPPLNQEIEKVAFEVDHFSSDEGYIDGILDEASGILYFN